MTDLIITFASLESGGGVGKQIINEIAEESKLYQPASEQFLKDIGKQIKQDFGKKLGPKIKRLLHDLKDYGERSKTEVKEQVCDLYREFGKEPPDWLK